MSLQTSDRPHWPITILSSISAIFNMIIPMAMARLLSPDEVGGFRIFFLYLSLVPFLSCTWGVVNGIYYWVGQGKKSLNLIQNAWNLLLLGAFVLSVILPILGIGVERYFPGVMPTLPAHTALFCLAVFPTLLTNFYDFTLIALGRIWQGSFFNLSFEVLRTAALLGVTYWTRNLVSLILVHIGISYLRVLVSLALGYSQGIYRLHLNATRVREIFKYAAPVSFAAAFDVLMSSSDRLLLAESISPSDYSLYVIGCLSIPPLLILEQSINKTLIPQLSQSLLDGNITKAISLYRKAVEDLLGIYIPATAGLVVFAKPIIHLLFTSTYSESAHFLRIFAFSYLLFGIPYDSLARATGDGHWILRNRIIFGLFSLATVWILCHRFGALGALSGSLAAQLLIRIYGFYDTCRRLNASPGELFPTFMVLKFSSLALCLSVLSLASHSIFHSDFGWFLIAGGTFGVVYLSVIYGPLLRLPSWITKLRPARGFLSKFARES